MPHNSFINDQGILEVTFEGDMTSKGLAEIMGRVMVQADQMHGRGEHPNILMDFSALGKVDPQKKMMAVSILKDLKYRRIAGYGASPFAYALIEVIRIMAGATSTTKQFKTREDAIVWLKE